MGGNAGSENPNSLAWSERWESVKGSDPVRDSRPCRKIAYNIAERTAAGALAIARTGNRIAPPCIRFWMRRHGTVMTADARQGRRRMAWRRSNIANVGTFELALHALRGADKAGPYWPSGAAPTSAQPCAKTRYFVWRIPCRDSCGARPSGRCPRAGSDMRCTRRPRADGGLGKPRS